MEQYTGWNCYYLWRSKIQCYSPGNDGINTVGKIAFVNDNLATTNYTLNSDYTIIYEVDIVINSNITYNANSYYNLKTVLVHELGHFLGLNDCNDINSVMYWNYTGRTTLSEVDINDLDSLY